jgi:hypothetical protein
MDRPPVGRSILLVEDEPLIAMDIVKELEAAGALVAAARTLREALHKANLPELSDLLHAASTHSHQAPAWPMRDAAPVSVRCSAPAVHVTASPR